jgi:hypothetical protein
MPDYSLLGARVLYSLTSADASTIGGGANAGDVLPAVVTKWMGARLLARNRWLPPQDSHRIMIAKMPTIRCHHERRFSVFISQLGRGN